MFVPGLHGIGVVLAGRSKRLGPSMLACLRWWTSRGPLSSWSRDENCRLLRSMSTRWGNSLLHIFDQGLREQSLAGSLARL